MSEHIHTPTNNRSYYIRTDKKLKVLQVVKKVYFQILHIIDVFYSYNLTINT